MSLYSEGLQSEIIELESSIEAKDKQIAALKHALEQSNLWLRFSVGDDLSGVYPSGVMTDRIEINNKLIEKAETK